MAEKLKNIFFTSSSVSAIADVLKQIYPGFDKKHFVKLVFDDEFEDRELKAKMRHTAECLRQVLPNSYKKAIGILRKAAPHVKGFEAMWFIDHQLGMKDVYAAMNVAAGPAAIGGLKAPYS